MANEIAQMKKKGSKVPGDPAAVSRCINLISNSEDWLIDRILEYAKERDYVRYTSTLKEAWRMSISGLSAALISAFRNGWPDLSWGPDDTYDDDPVASFGVTEAQRHRKRGVSLSMFLGLMKYYRLSYEDLVQTAGFERELEEEYRKVILAFFDRVELGFCTEWTTASKDRWLMELQGANRLITNEKNKYLTIFESLSYPIILLNSCHQIDYVNHAASAFLRKSTTPGEGYYGEKKKCRLKQGDQSLPGTHRFENGKHEEAFMACLEHELRAFTTGTRQIMRFEKGVFWEGRTTYFSIYLCKMLDVSGKFCGTVVCLEDRTDWKKAQDAIQESEEKYRTVLECVPDPTVVYDMLGRVSYINPAFTEVFGWKLDELEGKICDYVPEGSREETKRLVDKVMAGKSFSGIETQRLTKAGDILDVSLSASIYRGKDGHPLGSVVNLQNITERKKLEAQLQQTQKLESLGTLSGGIAHDFNNLLMSIQWNASLLYKDIAPDHPRYKVIKNIEERVESGAKLTAQLLGYARKGKYEIKVLDLNALVKDISETFGRARKDIIIRYHLDDDLKVVMADRGQIEQMLLNLYINASEAMSSGGILTVKTTNVIDEDIGRRLEFVPGPHVQLTVSDTGSGMPKETLERIFDPFFTTKKSGRARGLGLSSAYGIVKSHGGHIEVESERNYGTTFRIYLPASDKTAEKSVAPPKGTIRKKGVILLIDDEAMVLEIGSEVLREAGYIVLEASSGGDAVHTYDEQKSEIDLVILDIVMPDMNGGEVFDRIKALNPDAKVLLSSGYSIEGQATDILARGCSGFIQKPFRTEKLFSKISSILNPA